MKKRIGTNLLLLSTIPCLFSCGFFGGSQESIDKSLPINVYFYDADGNVILQKEYLYGEKVVYDADEYPFKATSEGTFVFDGWDINGDNVKDQLPKRITHEIHAYPVFTIDSVVGTQGLEFELESDNLSYTVTRGVDTENVVIPLHLNNKPVTGIAPNAFKGMKNIKSVALTKNINKIGYAAFMNCSSLECIVLPDDVKTIDSYVFCGCTSLKKVVLGSFVRDIYDMAFANCASLKEICLINSSSVRVLPDSLLSIGNYAFFNCGLQSIQIPRNVISIGSYAFANNVNLQTVTFLNNAVVVADRYDNVSDLSAEYLLNGAESSKTKQNEKNEETSSLEDEEETIPHLETIPIGAFNACIKLSKVSGLSDYIKIIDSYAFAETLLDNFVLPKSVERIGSYAFANCQFSHEDFSKTENLKIIDSYAFTNSTISSIDLSKVRMVYDHAFENCANLASTFLSGQNELEKVFDYAFANCIELTGKLVFTKTTYIGDYSFFNCDKILSCEFNMPSSVLKTLGNHAFDYELSANIYESISDSFTFKYIKSKSEIADCGMNVFLESVRTNWAR